MFFSRSLFALSRRDEMLFQNHRHRSMHIERECCLGPALADIWQLLTKSRDGFIK